MQDINFSIDDNEVENKKTFSQKIKDKINKAFIFIIVLIIARTIVKIHKDINERKKYKKIIKKGLFWDTEYLIEK